MDWEKARARTDIAYGILASAVGIILGVTMIGQGIYRIYLGIDGGAGILYFIGFAVLIPGGISVIALSRKDRVKMTGAYATALGVSRLFIRLNDISSADNIAIIIFELLFVALALNFIRVGFHFTRGNVVSRTSLIISASILASTDLLFIVADQYIKENFDFLPFQVDAYYYLLNFMMYLAIVALLDTRFVRENTILARYAAVLDRVRAAHSLEEESYIYDDVAKELLERSGPQWKRIDDGFVQSEMVFEIFTGELRSTAVAQIWKGKDPLFMTVMHKGDSIFNANRFRVDEIRESGGMLHGRGKDGTEFRILIKRREPA